MNGARSRVAPELVLLLLVSGGLNLWALDSNGWGNAYYTAAVRSMSSSLDNFFFGSFDASGVMTVDKPPLGLWVQVASVKILGFDQLGVLLPQALMGIGAVALTYDLTRIAWGRPAGFIAGLVLATTPITVAVSRDNNLDALLVLTTVAALWCLVRGLSRGSTTLICLAGACVGLGFETKMSAALVVVPALAAAWIWAAPRGLRTALLQLAAAGAVMITIAMAWPAAVAVSNHHPWIGGTGDGSVWSLIAGYNATERLGSTEGAQAPQIGDPSRPGPLRLLDVSLGGQVGWMLGIALVGLIGLAVMTRLTRADPRTPWLIATGGAFATIALTFSAAGGIFHPYYVSLLAPFSAALIGATVGMLLVEQRLVRPLAATTIAAGVASELVVLHRYPGELEWLPPALLVVGGGASVALLLTRGRATRVAAVAAALAVCLMGPAIWSVDTVGRTANGIFPLGGPAGPGVDGAPAGFTDPGVPTAELVAPGMAIERYQRAVELSLRYAQSHGGGNLAISSQVDAAMPIIESGAPLVGIGGFSGRESDVGTGWLAGLVQQGDVRWVYTGERDPYGPSTESEAAMRAVALGCDSLRGASRAAVDPELRGRLYDCRGSVRTLRAISRGSLSAYARSGVRAR